MLDDAGLRHAGWTDEDILSVTLVPAASAFAAEVFNAPGADPEPSSQDLDEEIHHGLLGRHLQLPVQRRALQAR